MLYMFQQRLEQLTKHVWFFPPHPDKDLLRPSVGVISIAGETILIDAGNGSLQGEEINEQLNRAKLPPVKTLIYTHHHWDHTFGSTSFKPKTVIAHEACADILSRTVQKEWSVSFIEEEIRIKPHARWSHEAKLKAIKDWSAFDLKVPNWTFSERLSLHFPSVTVDLIHVGGPHAQDSLIVHVPEEKVVFLGDCFYASAQEKVNVNMLKQVLQLDGIYYIHGHGRKMDQNKIRWLIQMNENEANTID
jgi:glyoxylase-like metal-dependent hydrolase (beta-lactamase superfamily II)